MLCTYAGCFLLETKNVHKSNSNFYLDYHFIGSEVAPVLRWKLPFHSMVNENIFPYTAVHSTASLSPSNDSNSLTCYTFKWNLKISYTNPPQNV